MFPAEPISTRRVEWGRVQPGARKGCQAPNPPLGALLILWSFVKGYITGIVLLYIFIKYVCKILTMV